MPTKANDELVNKARSPQEQELRREAISLLTQVSSPTQRIARAGLSWETAYFEKEVEEAEKSYQRACGAAFIPAGFDQLGKLGLPEENFRGCDRHLSLALKEQRCQPMQPSRRRSLSSDQEGSKAVGYLNQALRLTRSARRKRTSDCRRVQGVGLKEKGSLEYEHFFEAADYPEREALRDYIKVNKKP